MKRMTALAARGAVPMANMGMRGLGLVAKLVLMVYLARYFSLEDIGAYGLIAGLAAAMPALVGWGMTYFTIREVVGEPPLRIGAMMRDRLMVSVCSALLGVGVLFGASMAGWLPQGPLFWLVAWIVVMEVLAFDIHLPLVSSGRPVLANTLLFVRSALWIFPLVGAGLLWPELRTLEALLWMWAVAVTLNGPLVLWALRAWPWKKIAKTSVDKTWLVTKWKTGRLVYVADIGLVGMLYVDRYILAHALTMADVGLFTLCWTLVNAIYTLVQAGVLQLLTPRLVAARKKLDMAQFWSVLAQTSVVAVGVYAVIGSAFWLVLPWVSVVLGKPELLGASLLLGLMLVAMALRVWNDAFNNALFSLGRDRVVPVMNMVGLPISLVANFVGLWALGLVGSAVAMVVTMGLLVTARGFILLAGWRKDGVTRGIGKR